VTSVKLRERVCLVTGAGQGIGAAIARRFAAEGARLVVNDISRGTGMTTVAEIRRETGADVVYSECDVSRADQVQAMIAGTVERFGRLDVLVNNAARGHTGGRVAHELTDAEWDQVMDVCLKGAFLCARYALPEMIRAGGGCIINIASVAGFFGFPADTAYTVAKGGLLQLNRALAIDYAAHNIRVNAVSPGWTATPANAALRADAEAMRVVMRGPLIKRPALPEEIAAAAMFLASDEAAYITGANLVVDGGWSLRSALAIE
jgi:NAD(P)-dependent dehydrogenase (short-subunit alcohol dehydrogenase family)